MSSISFRSILIILSFVAFYKAEAQTGSKSFVLEDFTDNYTFYARGARSLRSMKSGEQYSASEGRGTKIVVRSYETGDTLRTILDLKKIPNSPISAFSDYTFSLDESSILLTTDQEAIYRRSYTAAYYIYNIASGSLTALSENGKQQLATFSADGKKVAFVRQNNLFWKDLVTGKETQITDDGKQNSIINGAPDWVYEEEFEFNQAFEWSPDSKTIAWIRFDETAVPEFSMSMFQGAEPSMDENKLYPHCTTFKYPKAGEPNSIVSVHTFDIASGSRQLMDIGTETNIYIPRIRWTKDPSKLAIFRLNRLQNHFEILYANPVSGKTSVILTEDNSCYIDEKTFDDIQFLDDNKHFIFRSERDGWDRIYLYTIDGKLESTATKGDFDVNDFVGCDVAKKLIYYVASEVVPYQREVYVVKWDGTGKRKLSEKEGINSIRCSEGFKYYSINWSNSSTPPQSTLYNASGKMVRVLDASKAVAEKIKDYKFNTKEFFSFNTSENVKLYGYMVKPPDFDATKKYPVLLTQYSGPNSQSALDRWDLSWDNYMAQLGYVIVCVDGRGTGARGEKFRKMTYLQLGKYETMDQIETAKYLGTLAYIDASRIGIWGWSFGGYISSSCMVKGADVFKAAIAVAPVTNWRYYDNIYTERFMRTPQENSEGYDQNSPLNFAENLKGQLLLCHGLADDNVHVQNTIEFSERLVQADRQFDMQLYANRNHGIYGGNTQHHLYTRMTEFLLKNL
ncbi:MAG: S9 family peptidase [Bacteroidales bacterium]|nr:S9 family peptidase [Bacteroidales bacterium]